MQSFESAVISDIHKKTCPTRCRHTAGHTTATRFSSSSESPSAPPRPAARTLRVAKSRDEAHEPVQPRIMQPLNRIENSQFHFLTPHSIPPVYHLPAPSDSHSVRARFPHFRKCRAPVPEWFPLTSIQCYNDIRYIHPGSDRNDKRSRNIAAEEEEEKA